MIAHTDRELVGVVLGSQDAGPLEFWIGVFDHAAVQLDDFVTVDVTLGDGRSVSFFGVVDLVRKRYEGAQFDSDAFRAAAGELPVEVSYAARVQVTRVIPEIFVPPQPGASVARAQGSEFEQALYIDQMERKLPIGFTRTGEPLYANLEFLDGTRGAHVSISGISGVATKTSYAMFLLYSLFHSGTLGVDATNAKAIVFNVKGEDLLWLDKPNRRLQEHDASEYASLGLPAGPFESVGLYAPARRHGNVLVPETGSRSDGITPYVWSVRELARERLLRFAFADADDPRSQLSFLVTRIERYLERCAEKDDAEDPTAPHLTVEGQQITSFSELVELLDDGLLEQITVGAASGTQDAFRRRLHNAAEHMGHLVRGNRETSQYRINWNANQVTVVDIHTLHAVGQMFVVGVLLKRMLAQKQELGTSKPNVFVLLDELNRYAPCSGWSPIRDVLVDIAERGRSLGISLFGAQQTASEVERRVVANSALRVVGRLDAAESERSEYGWLTRTGRARATLLSPGSMIVAQPELPTPVLLRFPFPSWATRQSEVALDPTANDDPFAR